jgi:hypothetical protein
MPVNLQLVLELPLKFPEFCQECFSKAVDGHIQRQHKTSGGLATPF